MSGGRKPPDLLVATSGGLRRSPRWRPHGSLPDFLGFLNSPLVVLLLGLGPGRWRHLRLPQRQRRGLPRPRPRHHRGRRPVPRRLRRGGRAPGHHSPGGRPGRHAAPHQHAHASRWPGSATCAISSTTTSIIRRPPGGHQPPGHGPGPARGRQPVNLALHAHRRTGPLYPHQSADADGHEIYLLHDLKVVAGLDAGSRVPPPAGHRRVTSFGGTVKRYEILPDPEQ